MCGRQRYNIAEDERAKASTLFKADWLQISLADVLYIAQVVFIFLTD